MLFPDSIRALAFDYGNTVVPFGARQIARCDAALADALAGLYGPPNLERLARIRAEDRMAPYLGDPPAFHENDLRIITARAVRLLYDREPADHEIQSLILARFRAFVESVEMPDYLVPLLERLATRYRLALCSNYPDGDAIRASLARIGLDRFFEIVVVSADHGRVKPHPVLFEELLRKLNLPADEVAFIGDNWLADIQGARRAGLWTVWSRQWDAPEHMPRSPEDLEPHATVEHLTDLEHMLPPDRGPLL